MSESTIWAPATAGSLICSSSRRLHQDRQNFVDAIDTERYSTTIIETLVNLARDMQMEIIAEGVEIFWQVRHLRERGIRKAQGYVFAPPLPGPSFLKLLAAADGEPAAESAAAK